MFKVGEVVFCAMRGSGVVENIETKTIFDELKEYIVIQMKEPSLTMMIPTERIAESGFRKMSNETEVDKVESILSKKEVEVSHSTDIKKRTKHNQEKLATGSLISCSEVVRDLSCMETVKALNNAEKTILMQAKKLLLDELSIIKNISTEEADNIVKNLLK